MFQNLTEAQKHVEPSVFRNLHGDALTAVEELKSKEAQLIKVLQQIDEYFVYRRMGFNSLFRYCVDALKLSEAQSVMYISVARKSKNLPALQEALNDGQVTVSKVSRVVSVMNEKNQLHWLNLVKESSKRELEKEIAKVNPKVVHPEQARYLTDTLIQLNVPMNEGVFELLKRVQDLISQKQQKALNFEETIQHLCQEYQKRNDPIERETRRQIKQAKQNKTEQNLNLPCPGKVTKRRPLKQTTVDAVMTRDQGQCCYIDDKNIRCQERRWLHIHHIVPVEKGGGDEMQNLKVLCFHHHRAVHEGL